MKLTSPEFPDNGNLPAKFTADGQEINPALNINGVPQGAQSLVLIMDDPDAVGGTFTHWVVYDIPVADRIAEDSVPGKQGLNSIGEIGYVSPMPPSGTHRYIFKAYALDRKLGLPEGAKRSAIEQAMQGHILGQAELTGLYKRSK
ncbi:MAG TPA: YbhB/YbcL family Raf kinase inhibitor-like protein [Candidatus Omnitrophota bacterium]|nr:YbhB/YbcL family Raf kinase inhibitor-like protein [Candidatus Omnitrophota bacterium]